MTEQLNMASVMTRHPQTIEAKSFVNSAKLVLQQYQVHQLPVVEGSQVVGVISVKDIERAEAMGIDTSIGSDGTVGELCNPRIYAIEADEALDEVLVYMALEHIDVALIMDGDRLQGLFTVGDACQYCARLIREQLKEPKKPSEKAA